MPDETVNVRHMVDDVEPSIDFHTSHLGFTVLTNAAPGGWNRIHLITSDLAGEVGRLRREGVGFRNDIVSGPGGSQILVEDPSGNLIELFQPAEHGVGHGGRGAP